MTDPREFAARQPIEKQCLSCGQGGHHYHECRVMPFGDMIAGAFGAVNILAPARLAELEEPQ